MHLVMDQVGDDVKKARAIRLREIGNTASVLVRPYPTLVGLHAGQLRWCIRRRVGSCNLRRTHKRCRRRYCVVLITTSQDKREPGSFVRCILFVKLCMSESALIPLLDRLTAKGRMGKNPIISHLDGWVLYSSELVEVELMVGSTDNFFNKRTRCSPFYATSLPSPVLSTLAGLIEVFTESAPEFQQLSFLYIMLVRLQFQPDSP